MQPKQFVVDGPVEQLEAARTDEQSTHERPTRDERCEVRPLRPQQHDGSEEERRRDQVEKPVGEDLPVGSGHDVEVVPLKELVEDDLVYGAHQRDTSDRACKLSAADQSTRDPGSRFASHERMVRDLRETRVTPNTALCSALCS